MKPWLERIYNGVVKENPSFVLMLGMCPTLAVTTSATNGIGMGLSTMAVLIVSNLIISLVRKIIPDDVRLPAYIVIVASLVTVVELLMEAYTPSIYSALGIYIPLIVVNCIILGRAEAYASKNPPFLSVMDGVTVTPNTVPAPRSSRKIPRTSRAMVNPSPIPTPSITNRNGGFLEAYASTSPRMIQFTTINEM